MSHVVIKALPFTTRVTHGAQHILARDQARARKLLAGLHPHGPVAFHEARRRRHHHEHHHETSPSVPSEPDNQGGSASAGDSIDVTDAGTCLSSASDATELTIPSRCHIHHVRWCGQPSHSIHSSH